MAKVRLCEICARERASREEWIAHLAGDDPELQEALAEVPLEAIMQSLFESEDLAEIEDDSDPFAEETMSFEEFLDSQPFADEDDAMSGLFDEELEDFLETSKPAQISSPRCPKCRTSWDRIKQDGRCGCPGCYEAFRAELGDVMNRLQRGAQHLGKSPKARDKRARRLEHLRKRRDNQLELLQNRLKTAIADEKYEEAAKLRDKIKIVSSTIVAE